MRRVVFSIAALGLAACVHEPAPVAPAPGMTWILSEAEGEGAKLAFGTPHSDDLLLMLSCAPRSGQVEIVASAPAGQKAPIGLSSGGKTQKYATEVDAAPGDGAMLSARTTAADPVIARFGQTGELAVIAGPRRTVLPGAADKSRRFVDSCAAA